MLNSNIKRITTCLAKLQLNETILHISPDSLRPIQAGADLEVRGIPGPTVNLAGSAAPNYANGNEACNECSQDLHSIGITSMSADDRRLGAIGLAIEGLNGHSARRLVGLVVAFFVVSLHDILHSAA